ncbi:hypothetical protein N8I77_003714 [Diaporthe amygdali]|uniref:Uncharacterized protein n=1 Tax=Phomopsis amygdali TaxID=1214568 RepID=A0AAD9SKF1_PHOAM|nr:hypothetical protein N8I77_003714 [Diaporthe amygdali]
MLGRLAFENDAVAWRAANPSSFGYHQGPVPYWHQQQITNANANGGNHRPSFPPVTVSKVNTGVCDVKLDSTGSICGTVCRDQPSLQCHLRDAHPGAASSPTGVNITVIEELQGENALKTWVLPGGWRDARYVKEAGRADRAARERVRADRQGGRGFQEEIWRKFPPPDNTREPRIPAWEAEPVEGSTTRGGGRGRRTTITA